MLHFISSRFSIFQQNESGIRTEDVLEVLREQGQSIALVMLSGVQYYTGQLFDIKTITHAAQQYVIKPRCQILSSSKGFIIFDSLGLYGRLGLGTCYWQYSIAIA